MTTNKLHEVLAKAIAAPQSYAALELSYLRGHDLSGTTKLVVTAAGDYRLESSVTRDEQPKSWTGVLEPSERDALLRAIDDTKLLDVPSSTRNLHDDEEPIFVTLRYDTLVHELRVWHDDAGPSGLAPFEAHVVALAKKLSSGEIVAIPAR